ncbi:MAG TPA: MazG-like family protein [Candidatus Paceibacterota bacterium]|jgi:NTP pyrophosphatase (non-canonical NTP hydrolase)
MEDLEAKIRQHLVDRKWDKLRPGDVAKSISIEAAELLENFQWSNPTLEEVRADPEKLASVRKELADVLIYAIEMSVLLNINTREAILDKLAAAQKKYPAELFKDRDDSIDGGTEEVYWQIKREYRKNNA